MSFQHIFHDASEIASEEVVTSRVSSSLYCPSFDFGDGEEEGEDASPDSDHAHASAPALSRVSLHTKKKKLIEMTKRLSKPEYIEIFKIFTDDQVPYSENRNGVFIYLNNVREETIHKVFQYIEYISTKKDDLLKDEEVFQQHVDMIGPPTKVVVNNFENTKPVFQDYEFQQSHDHVIDETVERFLKIEDDEEVDNAKISLKRKKNKYSGNMAKLMNAFKESKDTNTKNTTAKSYTDEK